MLTTKEFAERVNVPYTTVMGWIKDERIPGAYFDSTVPRGGIWYVPETAVDLFSEPERRPHRGRPPKPKPEATERPKRKRGRKPKGEA